MDSALLPHKVLFPVPHVVEEVPTASDTQPRNSAARERALDAIRIQQDGIEVVLLKHRHDHLRVLGTTLDETEAEQRVNGINLYNVSEAGHSGLGMFAAAAIAQGDLILREWPLIIYPQSLPYHRDLPPEDAYNELDIALSKMSDPHRDAFESLANSHPSEPSRAKGIIDTNALDIGRLRGTDHQYAAVCKDLSRVNHSCSPNAIYRFDYRTSAFELRALFLIPLGSQIFISYIDPAAPRATRHEALLSYSFTCSCPSCTLTGPALSQSDTRRTLIAHADADIKQRDAALESWARSPNMPQDYINRVDKMYMDLFETERLYYEPVWEGFAIRLCKACCALKDAIGARRWARLAAALNRAYVGDDRGWAAVEQAPEQTEWWGLRHET